MSVRDTRAGYLWYGVGGNPLAVSEASVFSQQEKTYGETAGGREFLVKGMTCEHCAASVTEEVEQIAGVEGVDVDVAAGRVTVRGAGFEDAAIREAVDEAGYEVAAAVR
jgi:copper chaperone